MLQIFYSFICLVYLNNAVFFFFLNLKNPPAVAGCIRDMGSIPGLGRSPGGGHGNPLQYSCLEKPPWTKEPGGLQPTVLQRQTRLKRLSMHARLHSNLEGTLAQSISFSLKKLSWMKKKIVPVSSKWKNIDIGFSSSLNELASSEIFFLLYIRLRRLCLYACQRIHFLTPAKFIHLFIAMSYICTDQTMISHMSLHTGKNQGLKQFQEL